MVSDEQPPVNRTRLHATRSLALMSDSELVQSTQLGVLGAAEVLLRRYQPLVRSKATRFFIAGADPDDVLQEGMVGLTQAIGSYRVGVSSASFATFADVCITRRIHTAVRNASRQKHQALNLARGDVFVKDGSVQHCPPEQGCPNSARRQDWIDLCFQLKLSLTTFEVSVLNAYLQGRSYQEMSAELMCRRKAIDNALQRARRKIQLFLMA